MSYPPIIQIDLPIPSTTGEKSTEYLDFNLEGPSNPQSPDEEEQGTWGLGGGRVVGAWLDESLESLESLESVESVESLESLSSLKI